MMIHSARSNNMFSPSLIHRCRGLAAVCVFISLSFSAHAAAKSSSAAAPKTSGPAPIKSSGGSKHCLWRVTNAKAPFYLLGSIHILRASDYPLAGAIDQAVQQAQQFYFEIDPEGFDEYHRRVDEASRLPR